MHMTDDTPVTFSLRLPADLAAELDALAEQQKRSRSNVIRYLLQEALFHEAGGLIERNSIPRKGAERVRMGK